MATVFGETAFLLDMAFGPKNGNTLGWKLTNVLFFVKSIQNNHQTKTPRGGEFW